LKAYRNESWQEKDERRKRWIDNKGILILHML
jgi:hypothetical protein